MRLTKEQVLKIWDDNRKHEVIAKQYNVSVKTISNLKNGITWKHVIKVSKEKKGIPTVIHWMGKRYVLDMKGMR